MFKLWGDCLTLMFLMFYFGKCQAFANRTPLEAMPPGRIGAILGVEIRCQLHSTLCQFFEKAAPGNHHLQHVFCRCFLNSTRYVQIPIPCLSSLLHCFFFSDQPSRIFTNCCFFQYRRTGGIFQSNSALAKAQATLTKFWELKCQSFCWHSRSWFGQSESSGQTTWNIWNRKDWIIKVCPVSLQY